jgi:hypothetical protein
VITTAASTIRFNAQKAAAAVWADERRPLCHSPHPEDNPSRERQLRINHPFMSCGEPIRG